MRGSIRLNPIDMGDDTSRTTIAVLCSKRPEGRSDNPISFDTSILPTALHHSNETAPLVIKVPNCFHDAAGISGFDVGNITFCHLRFGHVSQLLCEAVADFTCWISTDSSPWAAYRALIS